MALRRRRLIALGAFAALALPGRRARAAQLSFAPTTLEAPVGPFSSTLEVTNQGGGETTVQARAMSWTQPESGGDALAPSGLIGISPPTFRVGEHETQLVRLVFHTTETGSEQAFRILFDELPQPHSGPGLQFALRVSLPAFVGGYGRRPALLWQVRREGPQALSVVVRNQGQRHLRMTDLRVIPPGGVALRGRLPDQLPYILPGGARRWAVPLERPFSASTVRIEADTDAGPISTDQPVEA